MGKSASVPNAFMNTLRRIDNRLEELGLRLDFVMLPMEPTPPNNTTLQARSQLDTSLFSIDDKVRTILERFDDGMARDEVNSTKDVVVDNKFLQAVNRIITNLKRLSERLAPMLKPELDTKVEQATESEFNAALRDITTTLDKLLERLDDVPSV